MLDSLPGTLDDSEWFDQTLIYVHSEGDMIKLLE